MAAKKTAIVFISIVLMMCFVYGYLLFLAGTTTASDVDECQGIVNKVDSENVIPKSISTPSRPALFCDLGVRYPLLRRFDIVTIYGVTDQGRQAAIIQTIQGYRHEKTHKPVLVRFYERENWQSVTDSSSGVRVESRGPETLIREVPVP